MVRLIIQEQFKTLTGDHIVFKTVTRMMSLNSVCSIWPFFFFLARHSDGPVILRTIL